jgi:hypothetical protein
MEENITTQKRTWDWRTVLMLGVVIALLPMPDYIARSPAARALLAEFATAH